MIFRCIDIKLHSGSISYRAVLEAAWFVEKKYFMQIKIWSSVTISVQLRINGSANF
jgi:hypothetical protein